MGGDEGREELSDRRDPCRDFLANTSCDDKALDISTAGVPFDAQDREGQQSMRDSRLRGWRCREGSGGLNSPWGVFWAWLLVLVLEVKSVSLKDVGQRSCVEA